MWKDVQIQLFLPGSHRAFVLVGEGFVFIFMDGEHPACVFNSLKEESEIVPVESEIVPVRQSLIACGVWVSPVLGQKLLHRVD